MQMRNGLFPWSCTHFQPQHINKALAANRQLNSPNFITCQAPFPNRIGHPSRIVLAEIKGFLPISRVTHSG